MRDAPLSHATRTPDQNLHHYDAVQIAADDTDDAAVPAGHTVLVTR